MSLLTADPARAHVDVRPGLVERGAVVELRVELPGLRDGAAPSRLELAGPGIEVLASRPDGTLGAESRWRVRVRVDSPAGRVPLVLRAVYPDGRAVEVDEALTVIPADEAAGLPWAVVVVGLALALGLTAVFLFRRRA